MHNAAAPGSNWRWFGFACLFELTLGCAAVLIGELTGRPVLPGLSWNARDAIWGLVGVIPLAALLIWMLKAGYAWCQEITTFLDENIRPVFGRWSVPQLAVVSALAGFGEELLFRAVVQGELTRFIGTTPALLTASALFAAFHGVTRGYAVLAGVIGAYLGLLWITSGNLLVPVMTHAVYDLVALVYFFKIRPVKLG